MFCFEKKKKAKKKKKKSNCIMRTHVALKSYVSPHDIIAHIIYSMCITHSLLFVLFCQGVFRLMFVLFP